MNRRERRAAEARKRSEGRRFLRELQALREKAQGNERKIAVIDGWRTLVSCDAPSLLGEDVAEECRKHKHWCVAMAPDPPERKVDPADWENFGIIAAALGVPQEVLVVGMKTAIEKGDPVVHLMWVEPFGAICSVIPSLVTSN